MKPYTPPETSVVHSVSVPVDSSGAPPCVHISQYDITIPILAIQLHSGNNPNWSIPADAAGNVQMLKPDRTHVYTPVLGQSADGMTVYVPIVKQMTAAAGHGRLTVELALGEGVIHTGLVILDIARNPVPVDSYESSDDYKTLQEIISEMQQSAEAAANSASEAKKSETAAKNSQTAAKTSEDAAKVSQTAAKQSEDAAKKSQDAAKASETAAKNSQTAAKTSEINAAGSATAAKEAADKAKEIVGFDPATKQDKLTGVTGQLVGFNANGEAEAQGYHVNENMLTNWYLGDPVNSGGQSSYTSISPFIETIDKLTVSHGTVSVEDGYCRFASEKNTSYKRTIHWCDKPLEVGKTYTASVLAKIVETSGTPVFRFCNTLYGGFPGGSGAPLSAATDTYELYTTTVTMQNDVETFGVEALVGNIATAFLTVDILAMKVELGPTQTLAHKENGKWVLNSPPPDKNVETLKCGMEALAAALKPYLNT